MAALEGATFQAPASFTALPIEIMTQILTTLHKSELKNVRLICRCFKETSLPILFDRVILSSQSRNFEPFNSITYNPRLSTHVRTLIYDMQWFEHLEEKYYILDLYRQLQEDVAARKDELQACLSSNRLEEKLTACNYFTDPGTTQGRERLLGPWNRYVRKGYQEYRKQRQEQTLDGAQISSCLLSALRFCQNIQGVELRASWDFHYEPLNDNLESLLPRYLSSGFVGRSWHPLYLRPKKPPQINSDEKRVVDEIFSMIKRFGQKVTHFSLGNGCMLCPEMHREPQRMLVDMPAVFRKLTRLSLDIAPDLPPDSSYSMDYLSPALHAAKNLTSLTFRAKNYSIWRHKDDMRWWMYHSLGEHVFPKLTYLYLSGMAATAKQFLRIIGNQPRLQALHLESIELWGPTVASDEDWEELFDDLRQMSLKEFSVTWPLRSSARLSNRWLNCPDICDRPQWNRIKTSIERYVLQSALSLSLAQSRRNDAAERVKA